MCTKFTRLILLIRLLTVSGTDLQRIPRDLNEDRLPPLPSPLSVKKNIAFGRGFDVSFDIEKPKAKDWIGIYKHDDTKMNVNPFGKARTPTLYWMYTCGSQDPKACPKLSSGTVRFDGEDPTAEGMDVWTIRPAEYKMCLHRKRRMGNDGEQTAELIGPCTKFYVKLNNSKKKQLSKGSYISSKKTMYEHGETIEAIFKTKTVIQDIWVGIYKKYPHIPIPTIETQALPGLGEPEIWVYTSCNNAIGDQEQSRHCSKRLRNGMVSFNASNTGSSKQDWPLSPGEYFMAINFYCNYPFKVFKSATKSFKVKPKEER